MPEQYVRPALVVREVGSPRAAIWRFRLVALLLVGLLLVAVAVVFLAFTGSTAEDPGLKGSLPVPVIRL